MIPLTALRALASPNSWFDLFLAARTDSQPVAGETFALLLVNDDVLVSLSYFGSHLKSLYIPESVTAQI